MEEPLPEYTDPLVARGKLPDEQVARNEMTARRLNEAIEDGRVSRDGLVGFVCECGQLGCNAIVEMTLREYEGLRAHPRRFAVVAGHEAGFDAPAGRTERYAVVIKQGRAGRLAELTDPRAGDA